MSSIDIIVSAIDPDLWGTITSEWNLNSKGHRWLRSYGLNLDIWDAKPGRYYVHRNDDLTTKVSFHPSDKNIALLFKLTWGGV